MSRKKKNRNLTFQETINNFESERNHPKSFGLLDDVFHHPSIRPEFRLLKVQEEYDSFCWLIGEVNNGGFNQYFSNSSGGTWNQLKAVATKIGNYKLTNILDEVEKHFPNNNIPLDRDVRSNVLDSIDKDYELFSEYNSLIWTYCDEFERSIVEYYQDNIDELLQMPILLAQKMNDFENDFNLIHDEAKAALLIEWMIESKIEIIEKNIKCIQEYFKDTNYSPFFLDLTGIDEDMIKYLIGKGFDLNFENSQGWTPLFVLRKYGIPDKEGKRVYEILLKNGAVSIPEILGESWIN